jgi:hypothetical protein
MYYFMKKLFYWFLILLIVPFTGYSQDNSMEQMTRDYKEQVKKSYQDFTDYVTKRDKEFADHLKHYWKEISLMAPLKPDTTPKPIIVPQYKAPANKEPISNLLPALPSEIPAIPEELQIARLPVLEKPEPVNASLEMLSFNYYGSIVTLKYNPDIRVTMPAQITGVTIAKYWENISATHYGGLLSSLESEKNSMQINDWGYLQLVKKAAGEIYSDSANGVNLLTWYLLTKSGYKIKAAYHGNEVYLMIPSLNDFYGINFTKFDGINYYLLDKPVPEISTYDKDFPDATKIFDLNITNALNIGDLNSTKTIKVSYDDSLYEIPLDYNMNSIEFYRDYPLTDIKVSFDAAVSSVFKESVIEKIKPLVENKSAKDAVGFLLNLVQNGFEYKTDEEQFGREKFNFPEENLYYPYNDCNDRVVFFAYLVENLVGLDVIGVEYPGHIATAVHFNEDVPGDYLSWKGKNYVMADPTFINAPLGLTMPKYVSTKADIVEVNNSFASKEETAEVWDKVLTWGGKQGDNKQNMATDKGGNNYIAGYFNPGMTFGSTTLTSVNGTNSAFIAKFDRRGNPVWAKNAGGDGNDQAYNIVADPDGNLYVAGSFSQSITFGTRTLRAGKEGDIFLAKYDSNGNLLWANQAGLDSTEKKKDFLYATSFTGKGERRFTKTFPASDDFVDFGLSLDNQGNVYFTASFAGSIGFKINLISISSVGDFNLVNSLKTENDRLVSSNCEKSIAGFFAALNLAKLNDISIPGKSVQEALDKYNPGFKNTVSAIYENIGKLEVLKNSDGIITLKTENGKPITFEKIRIANDARMKIVTLPNGDARIDVLNGIKVGKAIIWFTLNSVRLFRANGNLLFDYDNDHTQAVLNMRRDILN